MIVVIKSIFGFVSVFESVEFVMGVVGFGLIVGGILFFDFLVIVEFILVEVVVELIFMVKVGVVEMKVGGCMVYWL